MKFIRQFQIVFTRVTRAVITHHTPHITFPAFFLLLILTLSAGSAQAGEADVLDVTFICADTCAFAVTLSHADSGWEHYADRWEILTPDGDLIATRVLGHPHVNEQPFTRSLKAVAIPSGVTQVIIRAHDSVHGYGGVEKTVDLLPL